MGCVRQYNKLMEHLGPLPKMLSRFLCDWNRVGHCERATGPEKVHQLKRQGLTSSRAWRLQYGGRARTSQTSRGSLARTRIRGLTAADGRGRRRMAAGGCGQLRTAADGCGRLRASANGCGRICGRLRAAVDGCGRPRLAAAGCGRPRTAAAGRGRPRRAVDGWCAGGIIFAALWSRGAPMV